MKDVLPPKETTVVYPTPESEALEKELKARIDDFMRWLTARRNVFEADGNKIYDHAGLQVHNLIDAMRRVHWCGKMIIYEDLTGKKATELKKFTERT